MRPYTAYEIISNGFHLPWSPLLQCFESVLRLQFEFKFTCYYKLFNLVVEFVEF